MDLELGQTSTGNLPTFLSEILAVLRRLAAALPAAIFQKRMLSTYRRQPSVFLCRTPSRWGGRQFAISQLNTIVGSWYLRRREAMRGATGS